MVHETPILNFMTKTDKIDWPEEEIPVSIKIIDTRQEGEYLHLNIGDNYKHLRKDDLLWCPRTQRHFIVMQAPTEATIRVRGFAFDNYAFAGDIMKDFGVTWDTIIRWCREGHIPADKIKGCWYIDKIMTQEQPSDIIIGDVLVIISPAKIY